MTSLGQPGSPESHPPAVVGANGGSATLARRRSPVAVPAPEGDEDWRRYLIAVRRYRWLVALAALLGVAAGIGLGLLLGPTYEAEANIWIDTADRAGRTAIEGPGAGGQMLGATGWVDLVQSYAVLDPVVHQLRLYLGTDSPEDADALVSFHVQDRYRPGAYRLRVDGTGRRFTLTSDAAAAADSGAIGDSVGARFGFSWMPTAEELPPGRRIDFTVSSERDVARALALQLQIRTDVDGNFMSVDLRGRKPAHVTEVVNAVAQQFVTVAADIKRQKVRELGRILGEQLLHATDNLRAAEDVLKHFRRGTAATLAQGAGPLTPAAPYPRDPVFAGYIEAKVSRDLLRHDRDAILRVLAQIPDSGPIVDALGMIGSVQRSAELGQALKEATDKEAELRALRSRYTDRHPPVQHLAGEVATLERHTIPKLARALVAELSIREAELTQQVDSGSRDLREIPALAIQDAQLQREATAAEQVVTGIQQRYQEARLAEVSSIPDVHIIDGAAAPHVPIFSLTPILAVIGLVAGVGCGAVGAVLLDGWDPKLRHPEQVTRAMGLPILGAVPHVSRRNGSGDEDVLPVIEALRAIRLNVVHAHGTAGPLLLTVTSPGRADGKSFITSNLACAFADAGYRTLLIDGDVRRGCLHRVLNADRKPGLIELLSGRMAPDAVVQRLGHLRLSFVGSGARTTSAPELLGSADMVRVLTAFRPDFDAILVDSPPLAAGVDAYALGTVTGAMVLVLRTGYSNRELAEAKLTVLDRLPIRVLGAVLNDVRLGGEYRYYSYYLAGYELTQEQAAGAGKVLLRTRE